MEEDVRHDQKDRMRGLVLEGSRSRSRDRVHSLSDVSACKSKALRLILSTLCFPLLDQFVAVSIGTEGGIHLNEQDTSAFFYRSRRTA
jgi:hypothetical protein